MPAIQVTMWKCPFTGKVFRERDNYISSLKKLRNKRTIVYRMKKHLPEVREAQNTISTPEEMNQWVFTQLEKINDDIHRGLSGEPWSFFARDDARTWWRDHTTSSENSSCCRTEDIFGGVLPRKERRKGAAYATFIFNNKVRLNTSVYHTLELYSISMRDYGNFHIWLEDWPLLHRHIKEAEVFAKLQGKELDLNELNYEETESLCPL